MTDISYPEEILYAGMQRVTKSVKTAHTEPTEEAICMNNFFDRVASHKEANSIVVYFNEEPHLAIRDDLKESLRLALAIHKPEVLLTKAICYYHGLDPIEVFY